ncbi:fumarylacetoacetate hydrolase family protein [Pigmentiphaga litoralis]|uniref:2-keto-4-pentenoate hydratase/2-oxohepta-3-ene-1,7-dioic acid hydratase in catechol pathway n=1 Tax=Pigmentiphaga litoralis TaxID=516702 RepID=A0A7Y9IT61_9BURK|nr:fumarylacetoacetate hydrolase family protein [Pigmentiphaga litoralis]NYE23922.1 2-keto-4-pentenoate hydratase/2-oxohepta-3-ene-1,7-dioic acid hydratase in catechol pathway [Pigmentiphaga litoralis]NYE82464.1 2-keto-4-pentenoate hydratase/2-oxohepta-3-ene-1,7-dioic acid hydratase in catechol pathway [Pigmentiphaga litoralis]
MKICRFNFDRIGLVQDAMVLDVTDRFNLQPAWPQPQGDWVVSQVPGLLADLAQATPRNCRTLSLADIRLESPVANPGKIVGAPINYHAHIEEANQDQEINHGHTYTTLERYGLFLKAGSSLIGVSDVIEPRFPDRRTDHEVELAVVIGKTARMVTKEAALDYVLGYAVGLDMTVRGQEWPGFRKSVDTYAVLGPWIVTSDEVPDPNALDLELRVNGGQRQRSNTSRLIMNVQRLIEYASSFYTLHPGDVIMTGTPEGVGPVKPGDLIEASVQSIGSIEVRVASQFAQPR